MIGAEDDDGKLDEEPGTWFDDEDTNEAEDEDAVIDDELSSGADDDAAAREDEARALDEVGSDDETPAFEDAGCEADDAGDEESCWDDDAMAEEDGSDEDEEDALVAPDDGSLLEDNNAFDEPVATDDENEALDDPADAGAPGPPMRNAVLQRPNPSRSGALRSQRLRDTSQSASSRHRVGGGGHARSIPSVTPSSTALKAPTRVRIGDVFNAGCPLRNQEPSTWNSETEANATG